MSAPATRPLDHGSAGAGSNLSQKKQAGSVAWNGSNASATRSVATVPGKWSAAVMNDTKGDQPRPTSNVDSTLSMASTNNAASVNGVYRSTVPPVASEPVMRERLLALAVALVGCSVLVRTCHEGRVVGIVSGITLEGGDLGVSLAEAYRLKEGGAAEGPVETLVVWGRDVAEIEAGEVKLATKARDEQGDRPGQHCTRGSKFSKLTRQNAQNSEPMFKFRPQRSIPVQKGRSKGGPMRALSRSM